jgi:hypothetical protein
MKMKLSLNKSNKIGLIKYFVSSLITVSCVFSLNGQQQGDPHYLTKTQGAKDGKNKVYFSKHANADSVKTVIKNVIVEFKGEPIFALYSKGYDKASIKSAIQDDEAVKQKVFESFKSDINNIYRQSRNKTTSAAIAKNYGAKPELHQKYYKIFFGQKVTLDSLMIEEIKKLPYVKRVHEDRKFKINLNESIHQINADSVWNVLHSQGDSVKVGIIDTGIDYNDSDLGDGFGPGFKVIGGYDFVDNDNDPMDENSHGTHVAGIVAANGAIKGIAPKALLWAIRVLDQNGSGTMDNVISGVEYSVDPNGDDDLSDKLDIVNMSLGGTPMEDDPLVEAIENAVQLGVTFCIAAGNSGQFGEWSIGTPGNAPSVITVGAVDKNDAIAYFSSIGPAPISNILKPDVVAPGVDINSTVLNNEYADYSGTSMATPHVTGVCALLKRLHPNWTPADFKSAIMTTAKDLGYEKIIQGAGRVDAYKAALVNTLVDLPSLNFGMDTLKKSEIWNDSIVMTIRNISGIARNYILEADTSIAGVIFTLDSSNFILAAGDQKEIKVTISVNNSLLPSKATLGPHPTYFMGSFKLHDNSSTLHFNWSFSYAVKLKLNKASSNIYDLSIINNNNGDVMSYLNLFDPVPSELMLPPGKYTIIASFYDSIPDPTYNGGYVQYPAKIIFNKVELSSGFSLTLNQNEAKNKIVHSTIDENGNNNTRDMEKWKCLNFFIDDTILCEYGIHSGSKSDWLYWQVVRSKNSISNLLCTSAASPKMDTLYVSDLNENAKIISCETRYDKTDQYNICFNSWGPYVANNKDTILTSDDENYQKFTFQDKHAVFRPNVEPKFFSNSDEWLGGFFISYSGMEAALDPMREFNIYMAPGEEKSEDFFYSLYFVKMFKNIDPVYGGYPDFDLISDPLRNIDDKFFFGYKKTPEKYLFDPGDTITYGRGANYPRFMSVNNSDSAYNILIYPKGRGPLNEYNLKSQDFTNWEIYNKQNVIVDSGLYQGAFYSKQVPDKYLIKAFNKNSCDFVNIESGSYANLYFDLANVDPDPPTLTSFFIENKKGRQTYIIRNDDSATIRFSICDLKFNEWDDVPPYTFRPILSDSTRLYIKEHSSENWQSLQIQSLGEDSTEGIAYRGKFAKHDCDSAYFDIKIVGVDTAGNRMEQLFTPAIYIVSSFAPRAVDDNYHVKFETRFSSASFISGNDINPIGPVSDLSCRIINTVKHGILSLNGQSFNYTPSGGFSGTDSMTYKVRNEFSESNTAVVKFFVAPDSLNNILVTESNQTSIKVFPNPVNDILNIQLNLEKAEEINISVFDLTGKKVTQIFSGELSEGEHDLTWNIRDTRGVKVSPSVYLLQLQSKSKIELHKIVINP